MHMMNRSYFIIFKFVIIVGDLLIDKPDHLRSVT